MDSQSHFRINKFHLSGMTSHMGIKIGNKLIELGEKKDLLASIIISNYNYARFLRDVINSALNQSYSTLEVIVVDDGSTDESREIIENYGDKIIKVLKSNAGMASVLNAGFSVSSGDVIFFLDSDDVLLHNTVEMVMPFFL